MWLNTYNHIWLYVSNHIWFIWTKNNNVYINHMWLNTYNHIGKGYMENKELGQHMLEPMKAWQHITLE